MAEAAAVSPLDLRSAARRGLAVYFALIVVLSGTIETIWILNPEMSLLVLPLMWSPAVASVIARLILREGFSDVSFRFGGLRTLPWYALGLVVPTVIGLLAFGTAWLTGLVGFEGSAGGFVMGLLASATYLTVIGCLLTAGEEIGWRGYHAHAPHRRGSAASRAGERSDLGSVAPSADINGHLCGWAISRALRRLVHGLGHVVRVDWYHLKLTLSGTLYRLQKPHR